MADDNYFDSSASPTLPQDDPLRQWINSVQSDPQLAGLMATDPQGAMNRMRELGIPPPPQGFTAYTDGLGEGSGFPGYPRVRSGQSEVVGGAPPPPAPYPQGGDPMTAGAPPKSLFERGADVVSGWAPKLDPRAYLNWQKQNPLPDFAEAPQPTAGTPIPRSDPRKPPGDFFDPAPESAPAPMSTLAQEQNTNTDVGAQKKKPDAATAFSEFGKSLQGVKPPPQVAPQRISSPNAPAHPAIQTQNLNGLLSLVGQRAPEVALTLGRLLATGKA